VLKTAVIVMSSAVMTSPACLEGAGQPHGIRRTCRTPVPGALADHQARNEPSEATAIPADASPSHAAIACAPGQQRGSRKTSSSGSDAAPRAASQAGTSQLRAARKGNTRIGGSVSLDQHEFVIHSQHVLSDRRACPIRMSWRGHPPRQSAAQCGATTATPVTSHAHDGVRCWS
jgi:hypothetical protein